ncbi:hypothetical protein TBLA_0C03340 [Henningerozyma blattae CBS 6284]|uniref:Large ribosomal subunit protein mL67 n=1 Tax=Henningerozyma blattae (strain ATCC 34711 / CBS 6284 / DSM 70876 / NBRC 10599 / NRRL Y-10934 / UCD 77-7) TaxID=1071380 RepID=I2H185_HENB6|nr:hypothetical protein TBLA_0C03340 [Tetrapisispora blattae CBS 6284]CCH60137.1 hypothetical protein TBLA_0C03340 [Tetrapisispora blattae CBS 6284]
MSKLNVNINKATSRFRTAKWLQKAGYAPQVFIFRNLESGQILYSQVPVFSQRQINDQFLRPNWDNKKPPLRRDIWKCMCVIDLPTYDVGIKLFQDLKRLRYLRDVTFKKETDAMRKKNEYGRIWYRGLYRPTYSQEAVADLIESLTKIRDDKTISKVGDKIKIHWEDQWRMGDKKKYWEPELPHVKHEMIPKLGNAHRDESVILKILGDKAKLAFSKETTPSVNENNNTSSIEENIGTSTFVEENDTASSKVEGKRKIFGIF